MDNTPISIFYILFSLLILLAITYTIHYIIVLVSRAYEKREIMKVFIVFNDDSCLIDSVYLEEENAINRISELRSAHFESIEVQDYVYTQ